MRRKRKAKIIATLGPASNSQEMIEKLFLSGVDVFRINMSHSSHDEMRKRHGLIRKVEKKYNRPIGVLADLQGPKLRVGTFAEDEVLLVAGREFVFDQDETPGDKTRVYLPHPEIFDAAEVGHNLLINDGRIRVMVTHVDPGKITTKVIYGGMLSARKGVNLPDTLVPLPALTEKDRADLEAACQDGVDWIALSFVQRAQDVAETRKLVRGRAGILAKIEKPSALTYLDEIMPLSDAIMIARGDLGVELPVETVPGWQKRITRAARAAGKPVVVATQMLESMIEEPVPTRAEVSDVATAIFEGADAVMLSAESAMGKWPEKAVETMDAIAISVEGDPLFKGIIDAQRKAPEATSADAISSAARSVAETLNAAAIVCYTGSGSTGLRAARERPEVPIIALTPSVKTGRRLAICWGLHCVLTQDAKDQDDMVSRACRIAVDEKFAKHGDRIVITAGFPLGTPGKTNMVRIAAIKE
ncbi:Pyruvate kinase [hydrothermal vent metagenome]|uniref:pyruvate kinase n=1 Tax=hydrothermal vent metagenome TaxID=652676 RepID=A0A3B0RPN1_9ZZZZ